MIAQGTVNPNTFTQSSVHSLTTLQILSNRYINACLEVSHESNTNSRKIHV
jgi:hypothetical protein